MSKARYIAALVLGGIIFVVGIILSCLIGSDTESRLALIYLSYLVATTLIHLIWLDKIIVRIACLGFGICAVILSVLGSMFSADSSDSTSGAIWFIIGLFCASFLLSATAIVFAITLFAIVLGSSIIFPFTVIKNARDIY